MSYKLNSNLVGQRVENTVEQILKRQGWTVIARNEKKFGIEMDRLMRWPNGDFIVLEIKSISDLNFLELRVSSRQRLRLEALRSLLQAEIRQPVHLMYGYLLRSLNDLRVYNSKGDLILHRAETSQD